MTYTLWKVRILTFVTGFIITITASLHQPVLAAEDSFFNHFGTAFAITPNGYLLTNLHVVEGLPLVVAIDAQQRKYEVNVIATDPKNDLALLRIESKTVPLYIDTNTKPLKGSKVSTIGFPDGELRRPPFKLASGTITKESGVKGDIRYLQISRNVLSDDSGTPLFDSSGAVVGLVSSIPDDPPVPGQIVPDINYVVKATHLKAIASKLKEVSRGLLKAPVRVAQDNKELASIADASVYRLLGIDRERLLESNSPFIKNYAVPIEAAAFEVAPFLLAEGQENAPPKVIKIGLVVPMSGRRADDGLANQRAAQYAIDHINSRDLIIGGQHVRFELQTEDDIFTEKQAIATAKRLVAAHVSAVVGYVNSPSTIEVSKIYSEADIPQISSYESNSYYTHRGYKTTFNLNGDRPTLTSLMTQKMMETFKLKRVSIIYEDTVDGREVARAARITAEKNGGTIVAMHGINDRLADFSAILPVVKTADPDLIYFASTPEQIGPLLEQLNQHSINAKVMTEHTNCSSDLAKQSNNILPDKQVYCFVPTGIDNNSLEAHAKFKKRYIERFGAMGTDAPYIYDSVLLVAQAMVNAKSVYSVDVIKTLRTFEFEGVVGKIGFDNNGSIMQPAITVFTYVNKKMAGVNMYRLTKTPSHRFE